METFKPTSFIKGDDFEKHVRFLYPPESYELILKTHDYQENKKDFVKSSLYPDFMFKDKKSGEEFWVEAKYRENLFNDKLEWCKYYQLERYKKFEIEESERKPSRKVIIAIGFGGRAKRPQKVFLVPLEKIEYTQLIPRIYLPYEVTDRRYRLVDKWKDRFYDYKK